MRNANINRHRRQRPGLLRDSEDLGIELDRRLRAVDRNALIQETADMGATSESREVIERQGLTKSSGNPNAGYALPEKQEQP